MPSQAEIEQSTIDLTNQAFDQFVEDIATMFDTEVSAEQMDFNEGTLADIKDQYKKLASVISVTSEGALNGEFHVVFDKEGLFTLAGTFVMQPEKVIAQNRKSGSEEEANEIGDALGEVGNLMVGSWDRVFREEVEEHGHFVQSGTFIGNPWSKPESTIRVTKDEPLVLLTFQITVDPLDPFNCTAIYPKKLFEEPSEQPADEPEEAAEEPAAEAPAEETPEAPPEEPKAEQAPAQEETSAQPQETPEPEPAAEEQTPAEPEPQQQQQETPPPPPQPAAQPQAPQQSAGPVSQAIQTLTQTTSAPMPGQIVVQGSGMLADTATQDIMRTDITWVGPEETVESVVAKMQQNNSGYLLVGKDNHIEGIVSKSDVRGALSPYLQTMFVKWRGPMDIATLQIKVKWIMSRPVRTVRPDTNLASVMLAMSEYGVRCMPVVDSESNVKGIVTVFDIFRAQLGGGKHLETAGRTNEAPPLV